MRANFDYMTEYFKSSFAIVTNTMKTSSRIPARLSAKLNSKAMSVIRGPELWLTLRFAKSSKSS